MFYIDQVLFVFVAVISSIKEVNATWAFRTYAPPHTKQSKFYHIFSFIMILIVGIVFAYAFKNVIKLSLLNGFIYWLFFDILYALQIKQSWYYLGNEASTDKILRNKGKIKALICLIAIIVLNII